VAGDWLKMRHDLVDDPAVVAISAQLDLDLRTVIGCLFLVWRWADRQSRDGNAAVTRAYIDRVTQQDGFGAAMVSAGWLEELSGGIRFPHFDRHMGASAKARALGAQRQRRFRDRNAERNATRNGTVTQRSRSRDAQSVTREEKSLSSSDEEERSECAFLAAQLRDRILAHKTDAKLSDLRSWADTIRLMIERDRRVPGRIAAVIDWATSDPFWQANLLSAKALRRGYDKIELQMRRANGSGALSGEVF
jgi:hypothetical protein